MDLTNRDNPNANRLGETRKWLSLSSVFNFCVYSCHGTNVYGTNFWHIEF